ncbi:MAG: hypothetical protein JWM11_95 [Planctomycetaceae bacterium]|nr:hypothetical protein [Planctomycetaceae bacterium]
MVVGLGIVVAFEELPSPPAPPGPNYGAVAKNAVWKLKHKKPIADIPQAKLYTNQPFPQMSPLFSPFQSTIEVSRSKIDRSLFTGSHSADPALDRGPGSFPCHLSKPAAATQLQR